MKIIIIFLVGVSLMLFFTPLFALQDYIEREAERTYMNAKKKCLEQKWEESISMFKNLIEEYPSSRLADDAFFWKGYCEEKIPDRQQEAFNTFVSLIEKYPNSSWADDAIVHQIKIAEVFLLSGNEEYRPFLLIKLNSDNQDIQHRAALVLGKAGDERAIPVLKDMQRDDILGQFAEEILAVLDTKSIPKAKQTLSDSIIKIHSASPEEQKAKKIPFLFGSSKWYDHYIQMLRKDDGWSLPELFAFGLWHILETGELEDYLLLETDYDRHQWYENTWESIDPTPATKSNEIRNEFERRVVYARANYGEPDKQRYHGKYLKDKWLIPDDFRAPWDSRGEVYIKYGEPSFNSFLGIYKFDWQYYNYGIDFILSQYKTNIHGDAIYPGQTSRFRYGEDYFLDYFINNREFFYNQNISTTIIKTVDLVLSEENIGKKAKIIYKFPVQEFKSLKIKGEESFVLRLVYSIFNESMSEIYADQFIAEVKKPINKQESISEEFLIELEPGKYKINLEIQDLASNKVAFITKDFSFKINSHVREE